MTNHSGQVPYPPLSFVGRWLASHAALDERLRLDDGPFAGERVEAAQEEAPWPELRVDVAEWLARESRFEGEVVEEAPLGTVGEDLVVDVMELLRGQRLDLEARLVAHAVGAVEGRTLLEVEAMVEQPLKAMQ